MKKTFYDFCRETGNDGLLAEWDRAENLPRTPETVTYGSSLSVGWVCSRGHRWRAVVKSRTAGAGCPVCANRKLQPGVNDLAARYPHLIDQWDREKNGALTPDMVMPGTRRKVWWRCEEGHVWKAIIYARTEAQRTGCPVCAGVHRKTYRNVLEVSPETE